MTVAGIVLAGGASSRFGGDKLTAIDRGRPVLHHALAAVASVADPVVLVLPPAGPVPVLPDDLAPRILVARDAAAHQGPLAGLAGGLAAVPAGIDRVVVAAGDMPSLVPAVLVALLDALGDDDRVRAVRLEAEPVAPLPLAVRAGIAAVADRQLAAGRRSLRTLLDAVATEVLPAASWRVLDPEGATLRDVDTRADLAGA